MRREYALKQLRRNQKEALIAAHWEDSLRILKDTKNRIG